MIVGAGRTGWQVAGTMLRGSLTLRNSVLLGPDGRGLFIPVQLKSMMNKRMPVNRVTPGQVAANFRFWSPSHRHSHSLCNRGADGNVRAEETAKKPVAQGNDPRRRCPAGLSSARLTLNPVPLALAPAVISVSQHATLYAAVSFPLAKMPLFMRPCE